MKKNKNKNIILIIIFIFFLYVPTISYILLKDNIQNVNYEKRKLAEMPKLSISTIDKFPKKFDKYFNDHLPYRSYIVNNWRNLNYLLFNDSIGNIVLVGKNKNNENWLFYDNIKNGDAISFIDGRKKVVQEDLDLFLSTVKEETKKLKKKNVDLYYVFCPNKSSVYSQNLPNNVNVEEDYLKIVYNYLIDNNVKNFYYAIDLLKDASKKYETYYRTDTHWNNYGSYIYIQDFINKLYKKEILENPIVKQSFIYSNNKDLHKLMGVSVKIKENNTEISYSNKRKPTSKDIKLKKGIAIVYENDKYLLDETILLVGDSFTGFSNEYLSSIYKKIIKVPYKVYTPEDKLIEKYHPDKLIYIRVERSAPKSLIYKFL